MLGKIPLGKRWGGGEGPPHQTKQGASKRDTLQGVRWGGDQMRVTHWGIKRWSEEAHKHTATGLVPRRRARFKREDSFSGRG